MNLRSDVQPFPIRNGARTSNQYQFNRILFDPSIYDRQLFDQ